ncbi:MAG: gamma-glutamyltransferase [Flavobacteriaceae bacterium]|jgi:gamma-glutamyltranspeptidase/glutathione hydrolase|nr:gamma-glutamyltransferase [Flavobacteriaceae bacterium]
MKTKIYFSLYLILFTSGWVFSQQGLVTKHAMVVSARKEASSIGAEIMKQGGNAFDAMVSVELALAVAYPFAGNIGGGGFMVYRTKDGQVGVLDYREKAPLSAHRDMYLDDQGNVIPKKSEDGAMAIGIPGTVAGIYEVQKKFGKLPWKKVVQPAIDLADKGIVLSQDDENKIKAFRSDFQRINPDKIIFDANWKKGDIMRFSNLAKTLTVIRNQGRDGFYKGRIAKQLVQFIQSQGGIITEKDLEKYEPRWRQPIIFDFRGNTIITVPPPSSGGIVLDQILKMLETEPLDEIKNDAIKYIQLLTEAERRAYADRSYYLGDPDFVKIPIDSLLSPYYLKKRMSDFSFDQATPSSQISYGTLSAYESNETTHYSIIDEEGNAVAATTTLNGAYGSKLYDSELGFFLNNEMDDFSIKPGVPNMFGLVGGEANSIQPEKRMLSSMTPTIVEKDGKLNMVIGTPGGSSIITSILQTILNHVLFGLGMQESVSKPRFHHQWLPDEVVLEAKGFDSSTVKALEGKGYTIKQRDAVVIGKVDAILVLPDGRLEGGADPRGDDTAVGF